MMLGRCGLLVGVVLSTSVVFCLWACAKDYCIGSFIRDFSLAIGKDSYILTKDHVSIKKYTKTIHGGCGFDLLSS